jgi:hypothetical protein
MPDLFVAPTEKELPADSKKQPVPHKSPTGNTSSVSQTTASSKLSLFTTFCPNPQNITFQNQEPQESILLLIRHHFITNIPWILLTLMLSIIPPLLMLLFTIIPLPIFAISQQYSLILILFYYLIVYSYSYIHFLTWFYNMGIITPQRIVDIDIANILNKEVSTTNLKDVVDASYVQQGFFQSFFNYGNVFIQTEGVKANFEFTSAPNPAHVTDLILDLTAERENNV